MPLPRRDVIGYHEWPWSNEDGSTAELLASQFPLTNVGLAKSSDLPLATDWYKHASAPNVEAISDKPILVVEDG